MRKERHGGTYGPIIAFGQYFYPGHPADPWSRTQINGTPDFNARRRKSCQRVYYNIRIKSISAHFKPDILTGGGLPATMSR